MLQHVVVPDGKGGEYDGSVLSGQLTQVAVGMVEETVAAARRMQKSGGFLTGRVIQLKQKVKVKEVKVNGFEPGSDLSFSHDITIITL